MSLAKTTATTPPPPWLVSLRGSIEAAVAGKDWDSYRSLLLQLILYGTGGSSGRDGDDDDGLALQERCALVCDVLRQTSSGVSPSDGNSIVQQNLVDVLWLVSCTITNKSNEAAAASSAPGPDGGAGTATTTAGGTVSASSALVAILKTLLDCCGGGDTPDGDGVDFRTLLLSNLDPLLLEEVGLIPSHVLFVKKMRLLNTKNYRQQKYNLLQEESEGYAKLLLLLQQLFAIDSNSNNNDNTTLAPNNNFSKLIGTFQLDPNRVLDLAIDVLEYQLSKLQEGTEYYQYHTLHPQPQQPQPQPQTNTIPVAWLQQFPLSKLPALIGFKLLNHSNTTKNKANTNNTMKNAATFTTTTNTSSSSSHNKPILRTIVYLATNDYILNMKEMSKYMPPITQLLDETYGLYITRERKRVKNLGVVRLSSSSSSKNTRSEQEEEKAFKLFQEHKEQLLQTDMIQLLQMLLKPWITITVTTTHNNNNSHNNNGASLLPSWRLIQDLFTQKQLKQITTICRDIGVAIYDLVHQKIQPWLHEFVPTPILLLSSSKKQDHQHGATKEKNSTSSGNDNDKDSNMMDIDKQGEENETNHMHLNKNGNEIEEEGNNTITLEKVVTAVLDPLLCTVESGCIGERPILYCELCRLCSALIILSNKNDNKSAKASFSSSSSLNKFLRLFLLPSLSLFSPPNPALSMELWSILKLMPYTTRYRLYREWRGIGLEKDGLLPISSSSSSSSATTTNDNGSKNHNKPLIFVEREIITGKDARYILKRLSNDNIMDTSREVAKVTHSNPLVVFTTILNQIESYDNLVPMMVDAVRFVSPLGLDVLSYCILSRLCGTSSGAGGGAAGASSFKNRSRSKESGVNVSQWLQSLESFVGAFFKRCPQVEIRGILHYIIRRLQNGYVTELGVLQSLLKDSGGWSFADFSPAASLSQQQIEGRAGSIMLKRETMTFGVAEKLNKLSSNQLRKILLSSTISNTSHSNDNNNTTMGVTLLILLAQIRSRLVFAENQNQRKKQPVKLIGNLYDTCQVVMSTLLDFLIEGDGNQSKFKNEEDDKKKDEKENNCDNDNDDEDFFHDDDDPSKKLSPIIVFGRAMPTLTDLHEKYGIDVASAWILCRPLVRRCCLLSSATAAGGAANNSNDNNTSVNGVQHGSTAVSLLDAFAPTEDTRTAQKTMLPKSAWDDMTSELFETFFVHNIYDLFFPKNGYTIEMNRIDEEAKRLERNKILISTGRASGFAGMGSSLGGDERVNVRDNIQTVQDEIDRLKKVWEELSSDLKQQTKHVDSVRDTVRSKKESFFVSKEVSPVAVKTFLSCCVFPRSMQSPDDALYCARFVEFLHEMDTPGFSTLHYIDELIKALSGALYGVTEGEAANLSILLFETWKIVTRWRYDKKIYQDEVEGKLGSYMVVVGKDHKKVDEGANKESGGGGANSNSEKASEHDGNGNDSTNDEKEKAAEEGTVKVKEDIKAVKVEENEEDAEVKDKTDQDDENKKVSDGENTNDGDKDGDSNDTKMEKVGESNVKNNVKMEIDGMEVDDEKGNNKGDGAEIKEGNAKMENPSVENDGDENKDKVREEGCENGVSKEISGEKKTICSVSYEQFETLFVRWHALIGSVVMGCLKSSEYMHTRACLIVLTRIVKVFPTRPKLGNKLLDELKPLQDETNSLHDIRVAAQAYSTQLRKARDDGVWREEDAAVVEARIKKELEEKENRKRKAKEQSDALELQTKLDLERERELYSRGDMDRSHSSHPRHRSESRSRVNPIIRSDRGRDIPDRGRDRSDSRADYTSESIRTRGTDRMVRKGGDTYNQGRAGSTADSAGSGGDKPKGLEGRWESNNTDSMTQHPRSTGRVRGTIRRRSPSPQPGTIRRRSPSRRSPSPQSTGNRRRSPSPQSAGNRRRSPSPQPTGNRRETPAPQTYYAAYRKRNMSAEEFYGDSQPGTTTDSSKPNSPSHNPSYDSTTAGGGHGNDVAASGGGGDSGTSRSDDHHPSKRVRIDPGPGALQTQRSPLHPRGRARR